MSGIEPPAPSRPPAAGPAFPDPAVLAQIANALFQAPPHQPAALPLAPALPAAPPSSTIVPAPSVITSGAPHAPAQPPVGPPDLPPVTIPSVVPTPSVPGPLSPGLGSSSSAAAPPGLPQPGGSPGPFIPAVPTQADLGALPRAIADILGFVPRGHVQPSAGDAAAAGNAPSSVIPAETATPSADGFYFLRDGASLVSAPAGRAAPPTAAAASPAQPAPSPSRLDGIAPQLQPLLAADFGAGHRLFDPHAVKRDFPILQQHVHGKPLIWLDNAATTQKPQAVIDRLAHFYEFENSNIHRAAHTLAARATDAYESAREKVRRFLNAGSVKDIVFVRGTTEGINFVAQSWGRRNVKAGDEIVVTWLEHHANIVPWQMLCAEAGARLRVAPVDDRGQVILEEYERLLGPKTKLVSITQVSNALGTVVPVTQMTAMARRHGATVVVDGAQSVSHMRTDVAAIGCDFFVFSGHKVFGPTGIGVVYGRPEVLAHTPPWQGGGNMIADVTFEKTIYQAPPERFEAGTGNIADAVGLGAAIDYVEAIGMEVIGRYEHELLVYATEKLLGVPGLKLIGTAAEKASVLSFVLDGCRTQDVGTALDREGIAVRAGHHCAQPILRRFGLESTVRPSLAFYNTREDVDTLTTALLRIQSRLGI